MCCIYCCEYVHRKLHAMFLRAGCPLDRTYCNIIPGIYVRVSYDMNIGVQSSLGTWTNIGQRWFALSVVSSVSLGFRARATHSRAGISGYLVHARYNRWIYNIPGIYSIILLCVFKCMSSATETQAMRCQESRAVQSIIH